MPFFRRGRVKQADRRPTWTEYESFNPESRPSPISPEGDIIAPYPKCTNGKGVSPKLSDSEGVWYGGDMIDARGDKVSRRTVGDGQHSSGVIVGLSTKLAHGRAA